jgi:ABC-type transport system involved in multi-copper enzyme maturation permease subunit
MAETHLLQHIVAFVGALWWTKQWLISRPVSRWRFAVSALAGSILWVYVAYTATGTYESSSGVVVLFQSLPLAYFSAFMAFVSVIGIVLGLLLWTEEEVDRASEDLPASAQSRLNGD